ncbi:mediator of RNA polymerase II transcription subunit 25-like isoform X2 [Halichondria panicea]|uniref:mediator of RNA polymerase II transcription subunit 25-like isoform X2 n=1 Tax=Halichondria panicea TaxID=6063 RepID=UPI00312B934B
MVVPSTAHRDVIFVIDSSACHSGVLPFLLKEYIQPCVEYFSGRKLPDISYGMQTGPVQYGLVTLNAPGLTYRPVCTYYPITSNPTKLLKWIADLRLEGGLVGHSLLLSEGLAAAMELGQLMRSTRESCMSPDVTVEKHCVLVLNQPPSHHPCVESLKHAGKTLPQIIKLLVEGGVHLSLISPRCLADLRHLVQKTLPIPSSETDTSPLDDIDHALHPGHLVLLQGFQLSAIKERKKALLEERMGSSEVKPTTDISMDTTSPAVKIESVKIEDPLPANLLIKVEPRSDSALTFSTGTPLKQEPLTESTSFTLPTPPTTQPVKIAVVGQASAQVLPTGRSAGSSSHNPIQIISPSLPNKLFFSQPPISAIKNEAISVQSTINETQSTTTQSTPFSTASSSVSMARTASGGVPSVGGTGPNLEMAMKAAQLAIIQAHHVSGQASNSSVPQPGSGSIPSNQASVSIGQNQQVAPGVQPNHSVMVQPSQVSQASAFAGNNITNNPTVSGVGDILHRVPTPPIGSVPSAVPQAPPPTLAPTPAQPGLPLQGQLQAPLQQVPRPVTIWIGIMEVADVHENQRQMRQIQCSVTTSRSDVIQEIQPNTWPKKMTMSAYPKAMLNSIMTGMDFNRGTSNLKTVNFVFPDPQNQNVSVLRQLMAVDAPIKMFAIVHPVVANTVCPIKALILVWNDKLKQFTGLIPLEQEKFVNVFKQVLIRHRQIQQQQQQLQQGGLQSSIQQQQQPSQPPGIQQQQPPGIQQQQQPLGIQQGSQQQQQPSQPPGVQQQQQPPGVQQQQQPSGFQQQQLPGIHQQQQQPPGIQQQQQASGLQQSGAQMGQNYSQSSVSYATPSSMQSTMSQAQGSNTIGQPSGGGIMGQRAGQGQQQQQGFNQGSTMGQQTQSGNGGMISQQQQQIGLLGQQQSQRGIVQQQQGPGMVQQQQGQTMQQGQSHMGQQSQPGMMGQQGQGIVNQQQQGQTMQQQQQQQQQAGGVMGKTGPSNMVGQQGATQPQSGFGQGGMTQQQQQQEKVKKFLMALINSTPEQREVLFQRMGIVSLEVRQQWLSKAGHYKQQLIQTRMQMMGGGSQQGVQQQMSIGHNMQSQMNQGGYNRPGGVGQAMGGIRPPANQMPPQQQQQHMPSGYNQWQGQ